MTPPYKGVADINYNLQHIEEDSQELEGAAEDYEDVEY